MLFMKSNDNDRAGGVTVYVHGSILKDVTFNFVINFDTAHALLFSFRLRVNSYKTV